MHKIQNIQHRNVAKVPQTRYRIQTNIAESRSLSLREKLEGLRRAKRGAFLMKDERNE